MTEKRYRAIALGLDGVIESAHMGHPDFRVGGRIFATLHHDRTYGMVALTPEQQARFIGSHPDAFAPESGAWGRSGSTRVTLPSVDEEVLGEAMTLAWRNAIAKGPTRSATKGAARKRTKR